MGGRAVDRLYTPPINRGTEPRKGDTTMTKTIDILARDNGTTWTLTPVSKCAREYFNLRYAGSIEMLVESIEVEVGNLGKMLRFLDGCGFRIVNPN